MARFNAILVWDISGSLKEQNEILELISHKVGMEKQSVFQHLEFFKMFFRKSTRGFTSFLSVLSSMLLASRLILAALSSTSKVLEGMGLAWSWISKKSLHLKG